MCFKRHSDGRWGLEPQRWDSGRTDYWRPLGEADKPWVLRGRAEGTQVVLLGQHERHDTTQAPDRAGDARVHWIARYLNGRFLRLPARSKCSCAGNAAATSSDSCDGSTVSSAMSSATRSPRARCI